MNFSNWISNAVDWQLKTILRQNVEIKPLLLTQNGVYIFKNIVST